MLPILQMRDFDKKNKYDINHLFFYKYQSSGYNFFH
jgi:hypothetical protein